MTDEQFHEFHLDGKQMVFLFMVSTVVAVVIFLCGVMVGRGVRASKDVQAAEATAELSLDPAASAVTGTPPPDLTITDGALPEPVGELTYPERLAGEVASANSRREPAASAIDEPVPPAPALRDTKTSPPPPIARPDKKAASAVGVEPPGDGFVVQVMALAKRSEAEAAAGTLASKGYPAFVSVAKTGNARFRVRVGKFLTHKEAEAMKRRLERDEKFRKLWIPP